LNLDEALRAITKEACELMRARMCSLMLLDESREWLDLRASFGAGDAYINKPRLAAGESLIGVVVRRKNRCKSPMCRRTPATRTSNWRGAKASCRS